MTTQTEVLKMALEALELNNREWKATADSGDSGYWLAEEQDFYQQTEKAITAIKESLANHIEDNLTMVAQQSNEQVEPVAWPIEEQPDGNVIPIDPEEHPHFYTWTWDKFVSGGRWRAEYGWKKPEGFDFANLQPLYTHPPVPTAQPKKPEQEPAWYHAECDDPDHSGFFKEAIDAVTHVNEHGGFLTHLYTTPPQRKPITDEQAMDAYCETPPFGTYKEAFIAGIRFIEAAHGIKE